MRNFSVGFRIKDGKEDEILRQKSERNFNKSSQSVNHAMLLTYKLLCFQLKQESIATSSEIRTKAVRNHGRA